MLYAFITIEKDKRLIIYFLAAELKLLFIKLGLKWIPI